MEEPEGWGFLVTSGPTLVERADDNPSPPPGPLPSAVQAAGIPECEQEEGGGAAEVPPPTDGDEQDAPILEPEAAAFSAVPAGDGVEREEAVPMAGGEKGPAFELFATAGGGDDDAVDEEAVQMAGDVPESVPLSPPAPLGGEDGRKAPIFEPAVAASSAAKEEAVEMAVDVVEPSAISLYYLAGEDKKEPTVEPVIKETVLMTMDVAEPSAMSPSPLDGEGRKAPTFEPDPVSASAVACTGHDEEDVKKEGALQVAGPSALSPSSSGGEDKKAPTFEPDPIAASAVACTGHDEEDMRKEGAMQDVAGPLALPLSSSGGEDKEASSFETDGAADSAAALGDDEEEDVQKDEPVQMAVDAVEPPAVSPSSSVGEDEEARTLEADSTADTVVGGGDDDAAEEEAMQLGADEEDLPVVPVRRGGGRRKRGRPAKAQVPRPLFRRKEEEEEVCFICFDGGDLVVCDRRGCPKVYHPSCVNRDEAFFRAKGRWNCGWHICSKCEKSARYMCYTCTYSLCKGCIKEAGFVCVRRNKGFCEACMNTVMLIETKEHGNNKMDGVDFDDKSSWEYLFKDYWLDLKRKLSLTVEELTRAKAPVKGSDVVTLIEEYFDDVRDAPDDQGATNSDSSSGRHDQKNISSRKRLRKRSRKTASGDSSVKDENKGKSKVENKGKSKEENKGKSISEDVKWASKELLEFVAHMKDGDISVLSQFEVQALLLEYIKRNKLRDPRKKSQIICDSRLQDLFGKSHVGHFEMLKLLESHFLMKEVSPLDTDDNQGGVVDPEPSQIDDEGKSDSSTKMSSDKKRKTRKRVDDKDLQANYDDYAAIDVHNITLMYLRRNLMEDLLEDIDTFNEKVVGSFVRIRISGTGQRPDMYRLVQVVGTGNAMEKYKTGKKTTDVTLEILNLDKTEVITIDIISNQEFSEEECKRLRQSIKCGFIGRLTVGEVQDKARALQAVRVNDWLESEKLRLGHLRDRASEKGRIKELRECVEKLQLLSTPEERVRRLNEVPKIHVDPHMDPNYESAEEEEEQDSGKQGAKQLEFDMHARQKESSFSTKGRELISPRKGGSLSSDFYIDARKNSSATWDSNRGSLTEGVCNVQSSASFGDKANESSWNREHDVQHTSGWEAPRTHANLAGSESSVQNNNQLGARTGLSSSVPAETPVASLPTEAVAPSDTIESEKLWHYQDPSGKIQGPFSMTQLRKWSTTGYFPSNLRIWRTSEKQDDSILLTDALTGKFQKDLPLWEPQHNSSAQPSEGATMVRRNSIECGWRGSTNSALPDNKQNMANLKAGQSDGSFSLGIHELSKADNWSAKPSSWSAPKTLENIPEEERLGTSSRSWGSSNDTNAWSGQPQEKISPKPVAPFSSYSNRPRFHQGRGGRGNAGRWNGAQDRVGAWSSNKPSGLRPSHRGYEKPHPNWTYSGQQSPGEFRKVQSENHNSNQWRNDSFNLPTAPQPNNGSGTGVPASINGSFPTAASIQPIISGWGTNLRGKEVDQSPAATKGFDKAAPTSNSVGQWGSGCSPDVVNQGLVTEVENGCPMASGSIPEKANMAETNASTQLLESPLQLKMPPGSESSVTVESKSAFEVPHEVPGKVLPEGLDRSADEGRSMLVDGGVADPDPVAAATVGTSDMPAHVLPGDNLQSRSCGSVEDLTVLSSRSLQPDSLNNLASAGSAEKQICPASSTTNAEKTLVEAFEQSVQHGGWSNANLAAGTDGLESASAKRPEASFGLKQKQDGSYLNPGVAENIWGQDQCQNQEPGPSSSEPVNISNPEVPPNKRSTEQLTPSIMPLGWHAGTNSMSGSASNGCAQSSNAGSGNGAIIQNMSSGAASQNPSSVMGPAQGNGNMSWPTPMQGNMNTSWGLLAQGNMNMAWGTPAPGIANVNMGLGAPPQANAIVNMGWIPPAQGNANVNPAWGAPAQGNTNPNAVWGAQLQGNSTVTPFWGAFAPGNANSNPGWIAPTPGNANANQNFNWGTPTQGNMDANAGLGTGQGNMNPTWDPSAGNPSSWNTQQVPTGDAQSGQNDSFHSVDSRQSAGRPPWNGMQSGGGGGSSRPPPRPHRGVCKFHENGHCKKGASCNYIHS